MLHNNDNSKLRVHKRVEKDFTVLAHPEGKMDPDDCIFSKIIDISEDGCAFSSDRELEIDSVMVISIRLPAVLDPVKFKGLVKRCEPQVGMGQTYYKIGIQFTVKDEKRQKDLMRTLDFFRMKRIANSQEVMPKIL